MLITTPIFYVNSRPHLGHAYSMVVADAYARWLTKKSPSNSVTFSTGTDEHGQKIWNAALKNNVKVEDWCQEISGKFKDLAEKLNISNSHFIRTTDPEHVKLVQSLWMKLVRKGDIYKGSHEGWYSISDETFYTEEETTKLPSNQRISTETGNAVEWVSEMNYKFRLSKYIPKVCEWLSKTPILPNSRANDLKSFIKSIETEQRDLSVSRRKSSSKWGIAVPEAEDEQVIYVWMDALTNYLTVSRDQQNVEMTHIVGKDILKFHAVYWPAILSALDLPLPKRIISHGHWTMDGSKMSKSVGNVVCPYTIIDDLFNGQADPLRYFLLRTGKMSSDSPFSLDALQSCYNNELVGNLGNLISRVFKRYSSAEISVLTKMDKVEDQDLNTKLMNYQFGQVADLGMDLISSANRFVSQKEPWKYTNPIDLSEVSKMLSPLIPESSEAIKKVMNGQDGLKIGGIFPRLLTGAYCDVYLTHDAPRVRKDHNAGWKHAAQVRAHFLSQNQDRMTRIVGEIVKDYDERGSPVFIPAPVTIGRPPVGGLPGMRPPPMGNFMPPPPPHHLAQPYRPPNMPMPPGNPPFFPFPPGVRPPFPINGLPGQYPPMPPMPPGSNFPFPPPPFPPGSYPPNFPPHMMMPRPPPPPPPPSNS